VKWCRVVSVAALLILTGAATHEHEAPAVMAPGWGPLEFEAPDPETYVLPELWRAEDARVLDESGKAIDLAGLLGDKIVLLSFIYTSCSDLNGCPLATHVLAGVHKAVVEDPLLSDRVRLISISFDPAHDTPSVMAEYAAKFRSREADWPFLTTASDRDLENLLDRYDQWTVRDRNADGEELGTISHVLRVYLIDPKRRVRNIYSVSFLHKDTVIGDIHSILSNTSTTR
jgi:cytochrome oxidase Cu insertion factor (SCO1/SenC/PrrC family)